MKEKYNRSLTDAVQAAVLGDNLLAKIDAYDRTPNRETMSALYAALIGRCASVNTAVTAELYTLIRAQDRRIQALEEAAQKVDP